MTWHTQPMAAFDFESTDKDPTTARAIQCALILIDGGRIVRSGTWLINPGVPIEPGATAVHGITDEQVQRDGMPAAKAIEEIVTAVVETTSFGAALVGHNLAYDLTLLDRECRRHAGAGVEEVGQPFTRVVDTMVLDRHVMPFRRRVSKTQGPYQMRTSAEAYGLVWDEGAAHDAGYDALQSARVAWHIGNIAHRPAGERPERFESWRGQRFNAVAGVTVEELHVLQVDWAAEQAAGLEEHFRKTDPDARVDGRWPLRPFEAGEGQ